MTPHNFDHPTAVNVDGINIRLFRICRAKNWKDAAIKIPGSIQIPKIFPKITQFDVLNFWYFHKARTELGRGKAPRSWAQGVFVGRMVSQKLWKKIGRNYADHTEKTQKNMENMYVKIECVSEDRLWCETLFSLGISCIHQLWESVRIRPSPPSRLSVRISMRTYYPAKWTAGSAGWCAAEKSQMSVNCSGSSLP